MSQNNSTIPSFKFHAQEFIPIIYNHWSGDPNKKKVILKTLSITKPFVVNIEDADSEYITLEDFFVLLDTRINQEFAYREELIALKNYICEEFNKLYDGGAEKSYISFVIQQRQRIIDAIFDKVKVDDKFIAEEFFNSITNGCEEEALNLNNFVKIVHAILWKPLLMPFPLGTLNELKKLVNELGSDRSNTKIEEIASALINYIQQYMEKNQLIDRNFETPEELRVELEKLTQQRKICAITVQNALKYQNVITEFESRCIEKVKIEEEKHAFLTNEIKLSYEELYFPNYFQGTEIEAFFHKIQRGVKFLDCTFRCENPSDYKIIQENLPKLTFLSFLQLNFHANEKGGEGLKALSIGLKNLTNLSTLHLALAPKNIEINGLKALLDALKELKNLSALILFFDELLKKEDNVRQEEIKIISNGLQELKNLSFLHLILAKGKFGDEGAKLISAALIQLNKLSTLGLCLEDNNIGIDGAKAISLALKELKNLSTLSFSIQKNNIGSEGANELFCAVKELKKLSTLDLYVLKNNIGDEGIKILPAVINELKDLSKVNVNLLKNNITNEGEQIMKKLRVLYPKLNFEFQQQKN